LKLPKLKRTTFTTSRLLDFCSRKELIAQTGHQPDAWPLVLAKELIDNAIDAAEDAGIAPKVQITVDKTGIAVQDNGPGLPARTIEGVLDFAVRVSSREAYISPTRGLQGNALKTIIMMPFVLHGERGSIAIAAHGIRHKITVQVDRIRQQPVIDHKAAKDRLVKNGTLVRVDWPDSASSILDDAKGRFLQIADDYTFLNPHLSLTVNWFGDRTRVKASDPAWKKWLPSNPTSAHWYAAEHFERLVAGYIAHDADAGKDRMVRELVSEFDGLTGSAKQKAVLDATGFSRVGLSALRNGVGLDHQKVTCLLRSMKSQTRPIKPAALGIIGKEHLRARFKQLDCEMASFTYKKITHETDGIPSVLETAFAWRPQTRRRLITGVNWSPGIINPFRELGKFGDSLDSILEQQEAGRDEPVIVLLHLACPRVEYCDRGKSTVVIGS
jgi:DNA topoisomerase VI subunit B